MSAGVLEEASYVLHNICAVRADGEQPAKLGSTFLEHKEELFTHLEVRTLLRFNRKLSVCATWPARINREAELSELSALPTATAFICTCFCLSLLGGPEARGRTTRRLTNGFLFCSGYGN